MTRPVLLEMKDVTKEFPGVVALKRVTLRVRRGEIHGLIGENGAGKTTLMKILSGSYSVDQFEGEIQLDDNLLEMRAPSDALREGIGVVPQELTVIDQLSVAENIVVGRWPNRGPGFINMAALKKSIVEFLCQQEINLDPGEQVLYLTAAEKQEVMIARALYAEPSVLILDEPTSSLSLQEVDNLFRILGGLREKGTTCIFITHKLDEIYEITDRTTVLRDGEVAAEFTRDEYDDDAIVAAMVGRRIEQLYPKRSAEPADRVAMRVERFTVPHPSIASRNIVEDVSFSVKEGEVLGIAGLVGAGRSELVNAIYGRLRFSGRISVDGEDVSIRNTADAKRAGIALVTEDRKEEGILPNLSMRANLTLSSLRLISRSFLIDHAKERMEAQRYKEDLDIHAPSIETKVIQLSGGNQQKVVLGRVLMGMPRILLLDEPTRGVDIGAKHEIYNIIHRLADQGISIVMISSELPELLAMSDRVIVLAGGRINGEFTGEEADEQSVMLAATGANGRSTGQVCPA